MLIMKKNILKVTLVAAIALFAGYNVYSLHKAVEMSDLALANVEALAQSEQGTMANKCCPIWNVSYTVGGSLWPTVTCSTGGKYKCEDCHCPY